MADKTFSQRVLAIATQRLTPTAVKSANYSASIGDLVPVDASGGSVIITIPTAPADGSVLFVKMINVSGAFTATITLGGADVFNKAGGVTSLTLSLLNQGIWIQYKAIGAIWYVIDDDLTLAQLDLRFANLNSPAFSGIPTVPTIPVGDNSQQIVNAIALNTAIANAITAVNPQTASDYATTAKLPNSPIYNNGVGGIGATITTLTLNTPLMVDSSTPALNDIILVKNEGDVGGLGTPKNGRYFLSQLAGVGLAWILTRCLDYDQPSDINETGIIYIINGTAQASGGNKNTSWGLITKITTVGVDAINYIQATNDQAIVVLLASIQTLTNKRITQRVVNTTQSATPAINTDNTDVSHITDLAQDITSMTTNLTGTPNAGDTLEINITDNGTARAIAWGASFEASTVQLPTTTVASKRLDIAFIWNEVTNKWRCIGSA